MRSPANEPIRQAMSNPSEAPAQPAPTTDWAELAQVYRLYLALQPSDAEVWCKLGVALSHQSEEVAAAEAFAEAVKQQPDPAWGWYYRSVHALFAGRMDEAVSAQNKARKLVADSATEARWVELNLAFCAPTTTNELVAVCRKILVLDPNNPLIWKMLGLALARQGNHSDALEALRRAVSLCSTDRTLWKTLIDALWQPDDLQEKVSTWHHYLQLFPTDLDGWLRYGTALIAQERIADGVLAYRRATDLAPHEAEAWNRLAEAYRKAGDAAGQIDAYRQFLQLRPDAPSPSHQLELFA